MAGLLDMLPAWRPPQSPQGLLDAAPGGYGPTTREDAEAFPRRLMGLLGGLIGAPSPEESERLSALYQKARETPASEGIFPQAMRNFGREALPYFLGAAATRGKFDLDYFGQPVNILQNPSPREMEAFLKRTKYQAARRIVDENGDVFLWDADAPALHQLVAEQLGITNPSAMDMIGVD